MQGRRLLPLDAQLLLQNYALPRSGVADNKLAMYTVAGQGAGAVRIDRSIAAPLVAFPSRLALSATDARNIRMHGREFLTHVTLKNIDRRAVVYKASFERAFSMQLKQLNTSGVAQSYANDCSTALPSVPFPSCLAPCGISQSTSPQTQSTYCPPRHLPCYGP